MGDFANIAGADGNPLPQLASVAEQSGKWCARNIAADVAGEPRKPFHYLDKGIMAMIGRNAAVAEVGEHRHELQGAIAFAAWLGVHAALLTTGRAKVEAFIEWAWDYFGGARGDQILDRRRRRILIGTTTRKTREQHRLRRIRGRKRLDKIANGRRSSRHGKPQDFAVGWNPPSPGCDGSLVTIQDGLDTASGHCLQDATPFVQTPE